MAMAIDTQPLVQSLIPLLQKYLDQYMGRYQIHRVCAHATVIHLETAFKRLLDGRDRLADQAALDWEPAQGDDLHEAEVFQHLERQVVTSPLLSKAVSRKERTTSTTTLVASALSPSFRSRTNGRPVSSFHRRSLRCSCLQRDQVIAHAFAYSSAIPEVFPNAGKHYAWVYFPGQGLKIMWGNNTGYKPFVVWNLQLDVVDLDSWITNYTRPEKRLRPSGSVWPIPRAVDGPEARDAARPQGRKFRGARYRPERRRWVAEMRPAKTRNKISFGDFKTAVQAARAVDVAFYHFGKPHLLNFPDSTPRILASAPASHGLDEKAKLKLVKEQAKWLASTAPHPSPSDFIGTAVPTTSHRSVSEVSSSFSSGGVAEVADDGTSRDDDDDNDDDYNPQPSIVPSTQISPEISSQSYPVGAISELESPTSMSRIPSSRNSVDSHPEARSIEMLWKLVSTSRPLQEFLLMSPPPPPPMLRLPSCSSSGESQGNNGSGGQLWEVQSVGCNVPSPRGTSFSSSASPIVD